MLTQTDLAEAWEEQAAFRGVSVGYGHSGEALRGPVSRAQRSLEPPEHHRGRGSAVERDERDVQNGDDLRQPAVFLTPVVTRNAIVGATT
jgi:hypothetical protein